MPRPSPSAPGELDLVRRFVNTLDVEDGVDALAGVEGWTAWAEGPSAAGTARPVDLRRLRELREAIRKALLANHDRAPLPTVTREAMDSALRWSGARTTVSDHGLTVEPQGEGPRYLAGAVLAITATALADGTWSRLKACRDDSCRWAFYDHSRSRTGQWCSMEVCGNRNKQSRWRERRG